ncbi:GDSL family lipase [Paenibacillus lemnae]|uniref:GDSL family lipase n=1 Tax=Paenibacillus lemnae TaxID=1330551 RepID=A0A848M3Z1_PAELE|nr:GDSL family lipase [Paenibacillus lemnae]
MTVEYTASGSKPWRIPHEARALFVPDAVNGKAEVTAGVRIAFQSSCVTASLELQPMDQDERKLDCVINGRFHSTVLLKADESWCSFEGLPEGEKQLEVYLPQTHPAVVVSLQLNDHASYRPFEDTRPKWICYGSSITQCEAASSPSRTWPALAAQYGGWHHTNLGFSANCHLEPMMARMIRDLPADLISLCAGVNIMGGSSLSERTFMPALIGFIQIIREKHVNTPITVQSPIYAEEREIQLNKVGLNLQMMREQIKQAVDILHGQGDSQLFYIDGLTIFGERDACHMPDQLHPDAEGYGIMAERVISQLEKLNVTPKRARHPL